MSLSSSKDGLMLLASSQYVGVQRQSNSQNLVIVEWRLTGPISWTFPDPHLTYSSNKHNTSIGIHLQFWHLEVIPDFGSGNFGSKFVCMLLKPTPEKGLPNTIECTTRSVPGRNLTCSKRYWSQLCCKIYTGISNNFVWSWENLFDILATLGKFECVSFLSKWHQLLKYKKICFGRTLKILERLILRNFASLS